MQQAQRLEDFSIHTMLVKREVAVGEVGTYVEKKISEIRLSIDSDLSRKLE